MRERIGIFEIDFTMLICFRISHQECVFYYKVYFYQTFLFTFIFWCEHCREYESMKACIKRHTSEACEPLEGEMATHPISMFWFLNLMVRYLHMSYTNVKQRNVKQEKMYKKQEKMYKPIFSLISLRAWGQLNKLLFPLLL